MELDTRWERVQQKFRTGSNDRGYILKSVEVNFQQANSLALPQMRIYSVTDDGGRGDTLYNFTNPNIGTGTRKFTVSHDNAILEGDTDYYLSVQSINNGRFTLRRTASDAESGLPGWKIYDRANSDTQGDTNVLRMSIRGTLGPSKDARISTYWFTPGYRVASIRNSDKTEFRTMVREEDASTTLHVRTRHENATTTFTVDGTQVASTDSSVAISGITPGVVRTVGVRVTAEDTTTTRDYTFRIARHATAPETPSAGSSLSANLTVGEWSLGMAGVHTYLSKHGRISNQRVSRGAGKRPYRLATVASVDMSGFRGFYANTIAVCFWRTYPVPSGRALEVMHMRLDGREFRFKDARRFTGMYNPCFRWPRPATGFDWTFGDVKTLEIFSGNTPATGLVIADVTGSRTTSEFNSQLIADYSGVRDPDGLGTFTKQWIRVDGGTEEEIPGETGDSYSVLDPSDRGKGIRLKVTFTDGLGVTETVTSNTIRIDPGSLELTVPTLEEEAQVWSATLTPGETRGGRIGCDTGTSATLCSDETKLTENSFTYDGKSYVVSILSQVKSGSLTGSIVLVTRTSGKNLRGMILTIGSHRLPVDRSDGKDETSTSKHYEWFNNPVTLASSTPVMVGLVRPTMRVMLEKQRTLERRNGKPLYVFDLKLSDRRPLQVADLMERVFSVDNGRIVRAKRIDKDRRTVNGNNVMYSNHWRLQVRPDDDTFDESATATDRIITVNVPDDKRCSQPGALCAEGRWRMKTPPTPLTFGPPSELGISIGDVTASESSRRMLFPITMSRSSEWDIRIEYEFRSSGTATMGVDFLDPTERGRIDHILIFAGETETSLYLPLIDDAIDDDGETIVVRLTSARMLLPNLNEYQSSTRLVLSDATGVGTIQNVDPMPREWITRFGRTVATQAVEAIGRRFESGARAHVRIGGLELDGSDGTHERAIDGQAPGLGTEGPDTGGSGSSMTERDLLLRSSFSVRAGGTRGRPRGPDGGASRRADSRPRSTE